MNALIDLIILMAVLGAGSGEVDAASSDSSLQAQVVEPAQQALQMGLNGQPALAGLKLGLEVGQRASCESLRTLNDLMLAAGSDSWLLEVIGEDILSKLQDCLPAPLLLAWARAKLRAFDPAEIPRPDQMLSTQSTTIEFEYNDEEAVSFEFESSTDKEVEGGPKSSAITFDAEPRNQENIEFQFETDGALSEQERLSSGEIAVHFEATLTREFSGPAEVERRFLWATFDYLRGESERAHKGFLTLLEQTKELGYLTYQKRAEVGLARLAFDRQRFAESFDRFDRVSVGGDTIDTQWLPELVWSAYFSGRDNFLNRLFEWIADDRIHPLALGDALGLVPRILEEQCRRADALKVTSYLIEAMRQPPRSSLVKDWGPYQSLMRELEEGEPSWAKTPPYEVSLGWLKARAARYLEHTSKLKEVRLRHALAQLLRTRIDMRLGKGLMRCRL